MLVTSSAPTRSDPAAGSPARSLCWANGEEMEYNPSSCSSDSSSDSSDASDDDMATQPLQVAMGWLQVLADSVRAQLASDGAVRVWLEDTSRFLLQHLQQATRRSSIWLLLAFLASSAVFWQVRRVAISVCVRRNECSVASAPGRSRLGLPPPRTGVSERAPHPRAAAGHAVPPAQRRRQQ
eukprot:scaffold1214_cov349-Prasinococcus_capsulatus_cf.AAC.7